MCHSQGSSTRQLLLQQGPQRRIIAALWSWNDGIWVCSWLWYVHGFLLMDLVCTWGLTDAQDVLMSHWCSEPCPDQSDPSPLLETSLLGHLNAILPKCSYHVFPLIEITFKRPPATPSCSSLLDGGGGLTYCISTTPWLIALFRDRPFKCSVATALSGGSCLVQPWLTCGRHMDYQESISNHGALNKSSWCCRAFACYRDTRATGWASLVMWGCNYRQCFLSDTFSKWHHLDYIAQITQLWCSAGDPTTSVVHKTGTVKVVKRVNWLSVCRWRSLNHSL